jgi:hypothetical protein
MAIPSFYSSILLKVSTSSIPFAMLTAVQGTSVSEDKEFKKEYFLEGLDTSAFESTAVDILSYKGRSPNPKWMDIEPSTP